MEQVFNQWSSYWSVSFCFGSLLHSNDSLSSLSFILSSCYLILMIDWAFYTLQHVANKKTILILYVDHHHHHKTNCLPPFPWSSSYLTPTSLTRNNNSNNCPPCPYPLLNLFLLLLLIFHPLLTPLSILSLLYSSFRLTTLLT